MIYKFDEFGNSRCVILFFIGLRCRLVGGVLWRVNSGVGSGVSHGVSLVMFINVKRVVLVKESGHFWTVSS